jgi:GntR family transcriptional regulator, transcriptional repressor for pyruvate dehydrogenase complex
MHDPVDFVKIKRKTVVSQVMEKIRELIASGQFKAGDRIPTEEELATRLGIGRSSIREAIKVFNYLGVLDSRTAVGTFVCDRASISAEALTWSILLGRDDYQDLIDTRGALEASSLVLLAERFATNPLLVAETLATLETQLERMRAAVAVGEDAREELARADYDFHAAVIAGSGNRLFVAVWAVLRAFMYEEIEKAHRGFAEDISTLVAEHEEFVTAIRSGDITVALNTVRIHIARIKRSLDNLSLK